MLAEIFFSPWFLGLLGLLIGSFLNVVIHRLPQMMERDWRAQSAEILGVPDPDAGKPPISLSRPASRCPSCGHAIRWYENIPVLSWLALRGRCSACGTGISVRYPLIELLTGALFAAVAWKIGPRPEALLWCAFMGILVALAFIDADTTCLPDELTMPLLWLGIAASAFAPELARLWGEPAVTSLPALRDSVGGAIAGYGALWFFATVYRLVRRHEGMGQGDFKLLAALGAWLGFKLIPSIILLSSLVGAVVGLVLILMGRRDRAQEIPFGPYLVGGGVAAVFFGAPLTSLYFR